MALALLIVGAMMIVQEPNVVDCNHFTAQCPVSFKAMLLTMKVPAVSGENYKYEEHWNQVQSYCSCMSTCMNYFLVYGDDKESLDKNNCFTHSLNAGVKGNSKQMKNAPGTDATGTNSLAGVTGQNTCSSCEEISGNEGKIFRALGGLALTCALALAVSATCEVKGVKMRNKCFSLCTLGTDVTVILLLWVATGIAAVSFVAAQIACDPDKLSKELSRAGDASTDSKDDGAAYFQFLVDLLAPLASGLCGQSKKFAIFALSSFVALVFTKLTVLATICICCKCTKDGSDKHDHNAKEMQKLMYESDSDVE